MTDMTSALTPADDETPGWAQTLAVALIVAVALVGPVAVFAVGQALLIRDQAATPVSVAQPSVHPGAAVGVPVAPMVRGGVMGPVGPVETSAAPVAAPVAVCGSDADCAALDYSHGRIPLPALGPADDGGEAYGCPAGWAVYDTLRSTVGNGGLVCLPATGVRYV